MNDPYASPQFQETPSAPAVLEPGSIKVFGILHIVFGGIGVFSFLASVVQLLAKDTISKFSAGGDEATEQLKKVVTDASMPAAYVGMALSLIVTILILRAGIQLVKKKKTSVKASIVYSYASISAKVIALILALTVTLPAINSALDGLKSVGNSTPEMDIMITTMKLTMTVVAIISPLVMLVYPILSFVLLKRKVVVDYLAQHGK